MKQLHNCRNRKQIYTPLSLSLILSLLIGQLGGRGGSWPLCVRQMIQQILGQSGALQKHKAFGDHAAVLPGITISITKKNPKNNKSFSPASQCTCSQLVQVHGIHPYQLYTVTFQCPFKFVQSFIPNLLRCKCFIVLFFSSLVHLLWSLNM